jgi:two-component system, chemotaxis family, CheB/CheR fusion protein
MVAERETGASIRIWTPACSTGEEAYSLAMLVTEHAEAAGKRFDLKVFATDAQETICARRAMAFTRPPP